ncbi:MAG: sulfurtransferase complex subunit TusC [Gammaproteobacteria bacterium]|nr:sulfurtransferase complex subunit TusC [Gammaproteobacteria bacterium]
MKKLLFVQDKSPHGSIAGQEGLDAILMGSAFADCTVLLLEDGIYQVLDGQQPSSLGTKNYSVTYKALFDYGVKHIFCSETDLQERDLKTDDLLITVEPQSDDQIKKLFVDHDVILSF